MTTLRTRALVHTPGEGMAERELDIRAPRSGEVRVRVHASGLCHSDLHLIDGDWPSEERLVLGHEAAGVVESVGEDVVGLTAGDHVALSWFPPCGSCVACGRGQQWLCTGNMCNEHRLLDGGTALTLDGEEVYPFIGVGALSEYVVVPQAAAIRMPRQLPFETGALIGCSVATGVGAVLNTAQVQPGQAAVVLGCGGVGLATLAGLRLAGASPIIAVDLSSERLDLARRAGATDVVLAGRTDLAEQIGRLAPDGVDVVFEAVGRVATILQAIDLVGPGGSVVLTGLTATDARVPLDAYSLAAQGKRLLGCNYGSTVAERDFPRLAERSIAGELDLEPLIGRRIPLSGAIDAFADLRAARGGRAVVIFD